jgi:hypothetical protein
LVYFPRFGMLWREKSGNPVSRCNLTNAAGREIIQRGQEFRRKKSCSLLTRSLSKQLQNVDEFEKRWINRDTGCLKKANRISRRRQNSFCGHDDMNMGKLTTWQFWCEKKKSSAGKKYLINIFFQIESKQ